MVRVREKVFGCVALVHLSMHIFWGLVLFVENIGVRSMMIVGLIARGVYKAPTRKTKQ